ncbi:type VI secretion system contractile sheath small subunit [Ralstonia mannitolilytica]|uniref:type VI secretion system contractile sheath small subunit n=1 Tax=Ralstonia mannitolilytica TaxID=105219 RepID=UPI00244D7BE2|nr:type VI secretion system contractile sheath small subunit [Ralstonia mannitolilytica]
MSVVNSSQKFIARNRAPRVQIEYDVEVYGSEKRIELPFVMGVLADLSGKPAEPLPPVADRKFLEIDIDNFDERMKALKPRVAFAVNNTLTGEGQAGSHSAMAVAQRLGDGSTADLQKQNLPERALPMHCFIKSRHAQKGSKSADPSTWLRGYCAFRACGDSPM